MATEVKGCRVCKGRRPSVTGEDFVRARIGDVPVEDCPAAGNRWPRRMFVWVRQNVSARVRLPQGNQ